MKFDPSAEQTRTFQVRDAAVNTEKREIVGCGVPLEVETEIWPGFREVFDQNCQFDNIDRAKLKTQHRELIGVTTDHTRADGRLDIVTRASKTKGGDDALALAEDGALDSFSIGFRTREYVKTEDDNGSITIRHTRVHVREFSLTDNPAYEGALVTEVRERHPDRPEGAPTMAEDTLTREQLDTALTDLEGNFERTLDARLAAFTQQRGQQQTSSHRTPGAVLQLLATGDADMTREYNELMERAYDGGTTADSPIKDGWVGDLTRIFDSSAGILSSFFSTGALPDKGMNIEYGELATNTTKFEKQENEGDDLQKGKVTLTTKTAEVHTYGGWIELTVQQIKRSTLPILDRSLEAMALAAGANKKAEFRKAYLALVTARKAIAGDAGVLPLGGTLSAATPDKWAELVVDASIRFSKLNLTLDGAIVSPTVFKHLIGLEVEGNRVFKVTDDRNVIGKLNLPGLSGDLSGITVACDPDRTGTEAEFANARAVRAYDSALVQLQDENIINLSKSFSAYRFGAIASEIPAGVVPVKFAA